MLQGYGHSPRRSLDYSVHIISANQRECRWVLLVRDGLESDSCPGSIYHATIATYFIALFHFASEYGIFQTANMGGGVISPLIVASKFRLFFGSNFIIERQTATSLAWMFTQYDFYVKV